MTVPAPLSTVLIVVSEGKEPEQFIVHGALEDREWWFLIPKGWYEEMLQDTLVDDEVLFACLCVYDATHQVFLTSQERTEAVSYYRRKLAESERG